MAQSNQPRKQPVIDADDTVNLGRRADIKRENARRRKHRGSGKGKWQNYGSRRALKRGK